MAFLTIDLAFLGANLAKLFAGAWVPLLIGGLVFAVLVTWTFGRARFREALAALAMPLGEFQAMAQCWESREPGGAIFLTEASDKVPMIGRHPWLQGHVRHENVLLLRVETIDLPHVAEDERLTVEDMGGGIYRGVARFGFMHAPDVGGILKDGLPFDWRRVRCSSCRWWWPSPRTAGCTGCSPRCYSFLGRTGLTPVEYFRLPPDQVVSVGVELAL